MTKQIITLLLGLFCLQAVYAYRPGGYTAINREITAKGDTIMSVDLVPLVVFPRPIDTRRYARLIHNIKVVYPIAVDAQATLEDMERQILAIKSKRAQQVYIKEMEKILKKKYTPILRKMTFSQGKILIKLIDRQTSRTSYDLVKELRGGFNAFFWQGMARLFGANLKDRYDKEGEDKVIEQLISLYERGLL